MSVSTSQETYIRIVITVLFVLDLNWTTIFINNRMKKINRRVVIKGVLQ